MRQENLDKPLVGDTAIGQVFLNKLDSSEISMKRAVFIGNAKKARGQHSRNFLSSSYGERHSFEIDLPHEPTNPPLLASIMQT